MLMFALGMIDFGLKITELQDKICKQILTSVSVIPIKKDF